MNIPGFLWLSLDQSFVGSFLMKAGRTCYFFFLNLFILFMRMFTHSLNRFLSHKDADAFGVRRLAFPCVQVDF